jgi:amino acid adenylation domain-containing protein/non-ribosomal peptide synthase protein (TIGR01720 family)
LQRLGRRAGSTLFMTLLCAFAILLRRLTGSEDVAIGTPVANRTHPDVEHLIGLFVNTLVLRLDLSGDPALEALLARTRDTALAAFQHQQVPFEQVLERLDVRRSRSHTPLFQVLFTLQNAPFEPIRVAGLSWSPLAVDSATAKFDLTLSINERGAECGAGLDAAIEYRTDLFRAVTIERFARLYTTLLRALPEADGQRVSMLPLLDDGMRAQLDDWRTAMVDAVAPVESVHRLFEQQAAATPNAVALEQGDWTLSYRVLEERANRLAHLLIARGVVGESAIGVWSQRQPDTLCALLAILKAGAAYVPLDPAAPAARLRTLVDSAGIKIIVGAAADAPDAPPDLSQALPGVTPLWLDRLSDRLAAQPVTPPSFEVSPDRLAYILFTSGSTGLPKGVCTPHRGVTRLVRQAAYARFGADEVFLLAAPLGFDASTLELWGPLLNGGRLVLPAPERVGALPLEAIAELVERHGVTTLWLTAGLFHLMIDNMIDNMPQRLRSLRRLLAGGDVLSVDHLRRAHAILPDTQLINGYGPTEGTTFTCCHRFGDDELAEGSGLTSAPIGRPIGFTDVYVLDAGMQPAAIGVPGELYLGGMGLARGYLGEPALTAERFVPNPFFDPRRDRLDDPSSTLYRSGDRVRWRADGTIEFLGRLDAQLKIRGFRIEPGEIEHALRTHPAIAEAVVTAQGDGAAERRLAAYLVGDDPGSDDDADRPTAAALRQFLLARLPVQLVPAAFCWLDALPLNANGKVDQAALPEPDWSAGTPSSDAPAIGDVEQRLVEIWSALLPIDRVDRCTNFFDAGGDSIIALQIVGQASRHGIGLTPLKLFQYQTVAELASVAEVDSASARRAEEPSPEGEVPLTPVQRWFFAQTPATPAHFNQAVAIRLPAEIERGRLERALQQVVTRHDAFRLRFVADDSGGWRQAYAAHPSEVGLQWHDVANSEARVDQAAIADAAAALQTGLDLAQGPLLLAAVIDRGPSAGRVLMLVAHHLVIDGVSWRILLDDLYQAYQQPRVPPAPKTASFAAWGEALKAALPTAETELGYWQAQIAHGHCRLPGDDTGAEASAGRLRVHHGILDDERTRALLKEVPRRGGHEPHHLVLTALVMALQRWCDGSVPTIDIEGHGRDLSAFGIDIDVSRTIGWFTAIHPLTPDLDPSASPGEQLMGIRDALNAVPRQGIGYGLLRYLGGHDELALTPAVGFNYLGQLDIGALPAGLFAREPVPGPLQAADMPRAHRLDINAWVERQRLTVEWLYDGDIHDASTIAGLADRMLSLLGQLIGDLTEVSETTDAAEVFGLTGLDAAGLAQVLSQVSFGSNE